MIKYYAIVTIFKNKGGTPVKQGYLRNLLVCILFLIVFFSMGMGSVFAYESAADSVSLTNRSQVIFNSEKGMPTDEANAILQTQDGYIWIGSYAGLIRYDGWEFENFSKDGERGLPSTGIRALFEDDQKRLWIGTNDQGVYCYENGEFAHCQSMDSQRFYSVRCFAQGEDGTVYAGTSSGLAIVNDEGMLEEVNVFQLRDQIIYNLSFDKNGVLWGTGGDGYVFALEGEQILYWFEPGTFNEEEYYSILAEGNRIYIGTGESSLIRLILKDRLYDESSYLVDVFQTENLQTINALYRTREGELWLGSETGYGYFSRDMKLHSSGSSEQVTFIINIMEDYEGNIWMASSKDGVVELISGMFQNANRKAKIEDRAINSVIQVQGLLYAATDSGLWVMDCDWNPLETDLSRELGDVRIRQIYEDSKGKLWVCTYGKGLLCYDPVTEESFLLGMENGLLSDRVRCVLELKNGTFAVGTTGGVNILEGNRVVRSYGQQDGIQNPMILCFLEKEDGTLLAGSDGSGIYAISADGKIKNIGRGSELDSGVIFRMEYDERNNGIWVSAGSALYFLDESGKVQKIEKLNTGEGSIFDIFLVEEQLLLVKSSGVFAVKLKDIFSEKEIPYIEYGASSGFTSKIVANSWNLYEDGVLYLCTSDGIFLLNLDYPSSNVYAPKTAISEITMVMEDQSTVVCKDLENVVIPGDTQRLTIRYACLSFDRTPCTVRYYLEGFDKEPIQVPSTELNHISYTNLPGGNYVFRISAINADGVHSETVTEVKIKKEYMIYERPLFWIFLVVVMILCIAGLYRSKYRQMEQRRQEYRAITEDALRTIANTIDAKDAYTNGHSLRVAEYSREIAKRIGFSEMEQERIYYVGLMHDIGKIGIPDAILNKPGKLSDEEFEIMKNHASIGEEILMGFNAVPDVGQGAASHHERYDGKGYPDGLSGEMIPLVARIICVADSFDAMATKRAYRAPMSKEFILSELEANKGKQFDPWIADIMIQMIKEGVVLGEEEQENEADFLM